MKVILVVASGVHTGKEIPFPGPQFLIGRDEGCHLRPASPAISKKHCGFVVREQKVFVKDLGSTNGTLVNDVAITDETELNPGDRIKVGPLDFTLKVVTSTGSKTDQAKPSSEALKPTTQVKQTASGGMPKTASQPTPAANKPVPVPKPAAASSDDPDKIAAMLLSMDDDDDTSAPPSVPEGSTVMEMPAVDATGKPIEKKKEIPTQPDSSAIARDLLSKMSRRPR